MNIHPPVLRGSEHRSCAAVQWCSDTVKQTCQCSVRAGEGPADVLTDGGPAMAPEVWPAWPPPWGPVGPRAPWGHRLFVSLVAAVSAG